MQTKRTELDYLLDAKPNTPVSVSETLEDKKLDAYSIQLEKELLKAMNEIKYSLNTLCEKIIRINTSWYNKFFPNKKVYGIISTELKRQSFQLSFSVTKLITYMESSTADPALIENGIQKIKIFQKELLQLFEKIKNIVDHSAFLQELGYKPEYFEDVFCLALQPTTVICPLQKLVITNKNPVREAHCGV